MRSSRNPVSGSRLHHFRHRVFAPPGTPQSRESAWPCRSRESARRSPDPAFAAVGAARHSRRSCALDRASPVTAPAAPARQTTLPSAPADTALFRRSQSAVCSRAPILWSGSRARRLYSPAVNGSSGSATSIRWCGTRARSSRVGLAVPSSMPRYTATESQLTISPLKRSASASESAVFPLPVGPRMITTSGSRLPPKAFGVRACRAPAAPSSKGLLDAIVTTATTLREISNSDWYAATTTNRSRRRESPIRRPGCAGMRASAARALSLGNLLVIRFDAGLDHRAYLANSDAPQTFARPASV